MQVLPPPDFDNLLAELGTNRLLQVLRTDSLEGSGKYLHWDKLRHLTPPNDLSSKEWWVAVKFGRRGLRRPLPLEDPSGRPFTYSTPDAMLRMLHQVDQRCSGEIAMPRVVTADDQARQHYLVNGLMEEAIRSSQLEGATTSRRVAKQLLRTGRPPTDRSERMILNNYRALQYMRDIGDQLTSESVFAVHRILTEGTLDDPDTAGRLQRPDEERVAVLEVETGRILHSPPPAEQLPARLEALCDFANEGDDGERFVHPVVRAILLHFWLAYDHPFEDGNGRTARALFYWYMRTRGYWLVEYLSISRILREAPAQYAESFLLTETDDGDTTYFVLEQLGVIERALTQLHSYLERKVREIRDVERLMRGSAQLNHRQLALLTDAMRDPSASYTLRSHATSHRVTTETARTDLLQLYEKELLERRRDGRHHVFSPAPGLAERLNQLD